MSETIHRSFATLLPDLEDGRLHADLSREIQDIVAELHEVGLSNGGKPKAKLTLNIAFQLDSGIVEIACDYKTVVPKRARGKTVMYATPDNNLSRQNPRQAELPLRDVNSAPTTVRAI